MSDLASGALPPDNLLYAPGLKRRPGGRRYWIPTAKDAKAGFYKTSIAFPADATETDVAATCRVMRTELIEWRNAQHRTPQYLGRLFKKAPPLPDIDGYTGRGGVYFLACEQDGEGLVKIGYSVDPAGRRDKLATGCPFPVKIIDHYRGPQALETFIHHRFRADRVIREWFRATPDLLHWATNLPLILERMANRGATGVRVPRSVEERPGTRGWNVR